MTTYAYTPVVFVRTVSGDGQVTSIATCDALLQTNVTSLDARIAALGIVGYQSVAQSGGSTIVVTFTAGISDADKGRLDQAVLTLTPTLTTAQQTAITLDPPIADLQAARTAITTAVSDIHGIDNTIQAFVGTATTTQLTSALKSLSAAVREFVDAQSSGDQALANALQALKARFS